MVRGEGPDGFGTLLPQLLVPPPGPRSVEMAARLARVESRNVTHLTPSFPVFWESARGSNVRDVDGNIFLDLTGAFGVSVAGHGSPGVTEEIQGQAGRLIHGMGDVHPPSKKVEFLEALARITPWVDARAILGSTGSEAVEASLKTALLATGRPGIVAFEGAYHGLTLGSLAVTAREDFRGPFKQRLYPGVRFVPFPEPLRMGPLAGAHSLEAVTRALEEGAGGDGIGAVIIEPIQGRAGVRIPPKGFLRDLASLVQGSGALLIFDEIFSGLGRSGSLLACFQEDAIPDLLCLGKGLGGGLPLSACVGSARVMDAWPPSEGEAIHTSTFLGHPLACAGGLAVLRELETSGLVAGSMQLGTEMIRGLREELAEVPEVVEVRGRGLFIGIDLADPETLEPLKGAAVVATERALRGGILTLAAGRFGHVLELSPPLMITRGQVDWVTGELGKIVRDTLAGGSRDQTASPRSPLRRPR